MRTAAALALLLAGTACKSAPTPKSAAPEPSAAFVQAVREEYDALGRIQAVLGWYAATQGETPIRKLTYIGHDRLFQRAALDAIAGAERRPGLSKNDALALRFVRRALTG